MIKKILSVASLFSFSAILSSNVVSCSNKIETISLPTDLKINWYDFYNQHYDKFGIALYSNVYRILSQYNLNSTAASMMNDDKIKVQITDESSSSTIENSTPIENDHTYDIQITVDSNDTIFNPTINPIIIKTNISPIDYKGLGYDKEELNKELEGKNGTDGYDVVRNYVAKYLNTNKAEYENSDLTINSIKNDPNFGISLWDTDGKFIDADNITHEWGAVHFTIGNKNVKDKGTIYKDQYFDDEGDIIEMTINL